MVERVIRILRSSIDDLAEEEIVATTPLIEGGYIDSFDIINLISLLERDFDLTISLKGLDLSDFETPEKIASFIHECKR